MTVHSATSQIVELVRAWNKLCVRKRPEMLLTITNSKKYGETCHEKYEHNYEHNTYRVSHVPCACYAVSN